MSDYDMLKNLPIVSQEPSKDDLSILERYFSDDPQNIESGFNWKYFVMIIVLLGALLNPFTSRFVLSKTNKWVVFIVQFVIISLVFGYTIWKD